MKKKYMSPIISIMEIENPTVLLEGSPVTTQVKGQTGDDDNPLDFGGDTKPNTTYSPW